jgi:hypothetical protein
LVCSASYQNQTRTQSHTRHQLLEASIMKKVALSIVIALTTTAAVAQDRLNANPSATLAPATASVFQPNATITQGFDTFAGAITAGWFSKNNSTLANTAAPFNQGWTQGQGAQFVPLAGQAGGTDSFAQASFATVGNGTTGRGQASNWLVSPVVQFGAGASLEFWTIKRNAPFDDSIEVRFSTTTAAANVGTATTDLGDFTNLAFTVNNAIASPPVAFICPAAGVVATAGATASTPGFPTAVWCKVVLTGFPATGSGRIAFRHNTVDTGNEGVNGTVLGVDTFSFVEGGGAGGTTIAAGTAPGNITIPARLLPVASGTATLAFTASAASSTTCVATGAGYSVAPSPLTLPAGTAASVTVTQNSTAPGTYPGTVVCTNAAGATPASFTYNFTHVVNGAVIPVPALNMWGALALLVGFGLFGAFSVRRFS